MLDRTIRDLRHAARLIGRNPLFALTAALSLAVGIGATTTIFTVVDALLLRPPSGVVGAGRVVDIGRTQNGRDFDTNSYPNYLDIRARASTLSDVYAYRDAEAMSLAVAGGAERIYGSLVSANYFEVLGVRPRLGRLLVASDDRGTGEVVVLGYRLWADRLHGDPAIVGRRVTLNGRPFVVVGVAPDGFQGTTVLTSDVWAPIVAAPAVMPRHGAALWLTSRRSTWLVMGGRLKAGVSLAQVRAELDLIGAGLAREFPDENRGRGLVAERLSPIPGNAVVVAGFVGLLMGIVTLVLAIACANVSGVLLARAAARRREIAVRLAIGAARGQLVAQLLTETLMLFALGAVGGLVLARAMTSALVSLLPSLPVPVGVSLTLDGRVLAFTAAIALVAALLSGLVPALHASRADLVSGLKEQESGGRLRMGLRHAFVVGQVALSLVLVVAAGLFARALQRAGSIDPGFDPRGVELASLDLSLAGYTADTGPVFARQLLERVRALPDVESATLAAVLPLGGDGLGVGDLSVPGFTPPHGQRFLEADWNVVEPGYFQTMRMPLARGRDFTAADRVDTPMAAIVNETAARQWWPGRDALGQQIRQQQGGPEATDMRTLVVVGIARDARYRFLGDAPRPFVFVPLAQQYMSRTTIVARTRDSRRITGDLRALVAAMNPNLPIVTAETLEDHTAIGLVPQRVAASVAGSLGVVGLLLAAFGVYGATAYAVARRTRDIGIRIALGAERRDVVRLVLGQGMMLVGGGALIGLALAAGGSRLIGTLLFGVPPIDPVTFGGAALLFLLVGLTACYVPTRRAVAIDATEALRYE